MKKQNQLLINNNFAESFFGLSDDNAGKLIKAIFTYHLHKTKTKNNDVVDYALNCIIPILDANDDSYINKCNKNKENAVKRWNANAYERMQSNANDANIIEYNRIEYNRIEKNIIEDSILEPIGEAITSPQGNDSKPVKSKDARYIELENLLKEKLELKLNKSLQSNKWYDDIRKLIEIDKISIDRVKSSILWHFDNYDRDYRLEIQSASSLREKFSKLEAQKKKFEQNNKPQMSDKTKEFFDKYKTGE